MLLLDAYIQRSIIYLQSLLSTRPGRLSLDFYAESNLTKRQDATQTQLNRKRSMDQSEASVGLYFGRAVLAWNIYPCLFLHTSTSGIIYSSFSLVQRAL